jgi:phage-related protein
MTELRSMFRVTDELDKDAWSAFSEYLDEAGKAEEFDDSSVTEQMKLVSEWASTAGVNGEKLTTQYQKISDVLKLVGIRALPGMLGIINAEEDSFNALTQSIYSANEAYDGMGTSSGMASELMNTTQGSIYKLTSSLSELKIQLFDVLQGPFQGLVNKLTDAVKWFNSFDKETQKSIVSMAGVAAAIGPALMIFGKLATGIAQLKTSFSVASLSKDKFSKNVTGTLAPALGKGKAAAAGLSGSGGIGGISLASVGAIAAIALIVAAFVHLLVTNEDFRNKVIEVWNGVLAKFEEAHRRIVDAINSLGFNFDNLGEAIYAAWDWICTQLAPILFEMFANI